MAEAIERETPSGLRGWLSEVYYPALSARETEPLARRLGDRTTIDDPIFGHASGSPAVVRRLGEVSAWLHEHAAAFERTHTVIGADRDVTEGVLALRVSGQRLPIPVAIVAEKRPGREVALRVYHSTSGILGGGVRETRPLLGPDEDLVIPPPVDAHLDALGRADVAGVVASLEEGGTVQEANGAIHSKNGGGGSLQTFYETILGVGSRQAGLLALKNARADDGRTCLLELTLKRFGGHDVPPTPVLASFERGESGLLRAVRIYGGTSA